MEKVVVISTSRHEEYLFFIPIVAWAWNRFGWEVHCMSTVPEDDAQMRLIKATIVPMIDCTFYHLKPIKGVREETLSQVSRLFAASLYPPDTFLMTSDADMLPLSDYWQPDFDTITSWGHDLTQYQHNPICYIGMQAEKWSKVMQLTDQIESDILNSLTNSKYQSEKWQEWWQVDQDIITERLSQYPFDRIDRGFQANSHYAIGRVDRGQWRRTLRQPTRIDAHLLRPAYAKGNFSKILQLLYQTFPTENFDWLELYRQQFVTNMKGSTKVSFLQSILRQLKKWSKMPSWTIFIWHTENLQPLLISFASAASNKD